jgi:Tfp pilus assembly protein PilE
MMRLLEVIVALLIVAVLGVLFGVALPDHRHIERSHRGQLSRPPDL